MNQIPIITNQIKLFLTLYSEIAACLVAASVLSLFVGWMLSRSQSKRRLERLETTWDERYTTLEETAHSDAESLEEKLQFLGNETKSLQTTNRVLTDSLRKNNSSIQEARAEAIELNRQHAETQERLQRIILQKDREIVELGIQINQKLSTPNILRSTHIAPNAATRLSRRVNRFGDSELNHADTVAINPAELFDATIQLSAQDILQKPTQPSVKITPDLDESHDATADLSGILADELEESTVALDEEALAFAQRSYPASRRD